MDIRRAYHRRGIKRARLQKRLALAAMLAVVGCAAFVLQPEPLQPAQAPGAAAEPAARTSAAPALHRVAADAAPSRQRRVYPYSIVPGGVTSRAELAHAVMADKVVAAHYAGFAVEKASLRTVAGARAVYVSYRKGDQVYWTARKVTLADGETIVSDGSNEIRARCGNRISDTPRLPVEVKGPDERELDTPLDPAGDAGDGALRQTAFALDEEAADRQADALASFADGAGLLAAAPAQPHAGADQASLSGLLDPGIKRPLLAGLSSTVSRVASRTAGSSSTGRTPAGSTPAGSIPTGSAPAPSTTINSGTMNSGQAETGGASSGGVPDTGIRDNSGSGSVGTGTDAGTAADTGTGAGPGTSHSPDTSKPPAPGPAADPLPDGATPPKTHDLPEPNSLWLTGVAIAALLLQRRRGARRPR
jgi:hypothetical protein